MNQGPGGWGEGMRSGFRFGPSGIWWHNPDLIQKLTLTPDQQKRMDDILQQSRLQLIDLRANVEKQELLMEPMLAANPPDTNKCPGADRPHGAGSRGARKGECQDASQHSQRAHPRPVDQVAS